MVDFRVVRGLDEKLTLEIAGRGTLNPKNPPKVLNPKPLNPKP